MKRKEERERKAKIRADQYSHPVEWNDCYHHWIEGAEWADENPDERMIAKYLYEKKGYPIDLNGNTPSFEETMKDVEQYNKYKEDKFIDKVCEWLVDNIYGYVEESQKYSDGYSIDLSSLVSDLRRAMEE